MTVFGTPSKELAAQLGVTDETLRKTARRHSWPRTEIGRAMYFTAEHLEQIQALHTTTGSASSPVGRPNGRITRGST